MPFIARYRKEATGTLDDVQLRTLDERLRYLRELEERRKAILDSIESQDKLDDALRREILSADTKARLCFFSTRAHSGVLVSPALLTRLRPIKHPSSLVAALQ